MELKQFHLPYHYRGVEIEMLCLAESRYELIPLTGVRNATVKRLAYFDKEVINECVHNPGVVYVRKSKDTNYTVDIPDYPILLSDFQNIVDNYKS